MDRGAIWDSLIKIKIKRDDSYKFTLKEIETFAQIYNMDVEDFYTNVLNISKKQIRDLRCGRSHSAKCKEYKEFRTKFFQEKSQSYRLQIIKEKIKRDSSKSFHMEELKELSSTIGVNINDICRNILGIGERILTDFNSGKYEKVSSKK